MRHYNSSCVWLEALLERVENKGAFLVTLGAREAKPFLFQLNERTHNSVVFNRRGDDVVARLKEALDDYIQAFCDILCEYNILAVVATEHIAEHLSCVENKTFKIEGRLVSSAVDVSTDAGHVFKYCGRYGFRLRESRSCVI